MLKTVAATGINYASKSSDHVVRQRMPLSFLKVGETARIAKIRDKGEIHHHLENLGFVEGAQVRVISEQKGNQIVEIKGSQVALDKSIASRILTC